MFYKDSKYEKGNYLTSTSLVSALLISINLMTIYFFLEYKDIIAVEINKFIVVAFMALVWVINYFGVVRREEFLHRNFSKDKKGGYYVVWVIILTALLSFTMGSLNREKIFSKRDYMERSK